MTDLIPGRSISDYSDQTTLVLFDIYVSSKYFSAL